MPLTRSRKKKAEAKEEEPPAEQPKPEETVEQLRDQDDGDLERALEESKRAGDEEDEDMKRALELSMESLEEDEDFYRVLEQSKIESQSNLENPTASTSSEGQHSGSDSRLQNVGPSQRSLDEREDINMALELSKLSQDKEREDLKRVLERSKLDNTLTGSAESQSSLPDPDASRSNSDPISASAQNGNIDEFDQMAAGPSTSLAERINSSSIVINSDDDEATSKPASASVIIDSGDDSVILQGNSSKKAPSKAASASVIIDSGDDSVVLQDTAGSSVLIDSGEDTSIRETSRSGWLEVESGETSDSEDGDFNASLHRGVGNYRRRRRDSDEEDDDPQMGPAAQRGELMSAEEKSERMRTMFQSGLAIHFAGEEMQACKAVKTPLFPHQRVALAWMYKHENRRMTGCWAGSWRMTWVSENHSLLWL